MFEAYKNRQRGVFPQNMFLQILHQTHIDKQHPRRLRQAYLPHVGRVALVRLGDRTRKVLVALHVPVVVGLPRRLVGGRPVDGEEGDHLLPEGGDVDETRRDEVEGGLRLPYIR